MNEVRITNIITRIKDGETTAFVELIESYKDMVYTLCLRMTNSLEDAEEVAQDTFVKAYQNISKFKGKSKFSTWLYKIAYRTAVNYHRKKRVKTTNFDAIESPKSLDTSFDELQHNERSKYIEAALKELEPIERGIITFFYLEGYSIEEIRNNHSPHQV